MRFKRPFPLLGASCLLAACIAALPAPARAACAKGDDRCLERCSAWNNWCRPACGDWNGYCAGQPLPTIIDRIAPQSFFADPWRHGQQTETPYQESRWQGNPPRAKSKQARTGGKVRNAHTSSASAKANASAR